MTESPVRNSRLGWVVGAAALLALALLPARPAYAQDSGPLRLEFVYGSEKKKWLEDVTKAFEATAPNVDGRTIKIVLTPKGSGESVRDVIEGHSKPHLISPASGAYLTLGNAEATARNQGPLVGPVHSLQSLVRSPVVIAMWKPMAKALGWPNKPVGWKELHDLAVKPSGWGAIGYPHLGAFKFGHTHPEYSNSGLIALLAQVYAATGKDSGLTVKDVEEPATARFLAEMQRSVVHYGESTGFFADTMFTEGGSNFLSAAVLYENLVIESYRDKKYLDKLTEQVVAIYPKEGTFWSDHPVGLVQRPWVTDAHKAAAKLYVDFLLRREQQERALEFGFRPGVTSVSIGPPIDTAHGVDPTWPGSHKVLFPPDDVEVMRACLRSWKQNKKSAHIVLVFDRSNRMNFNDQFFNALDGAEEVIDALGENDVLSVLGFADEPVWVERDGKFSQKAARDELKDKLYKLGTRQRGRALYDAVLAAHEHLAANRQAGTISAIILLADATPDNVSKISERALLEKIRVDGKTGNETRVYTFAYGLAEKAKFLKAIAAATRAKAVEGDKDTVRKKIKDLAAFSLAGR